MTEVPPKGPEFLIHTEGVYTDPPDQRNVGWHNLHPLFIISKMLKRILREIVITGQHFNELKNEGTSRMTKLVQRRVRETNT